MTGAVDDAFERCYGGRAEVVVRAPGRVNVIGEHTDYNDGWVMPAAIDRGTDVAARRRADRELRVSSSAMGETDVVSLEDLRPTSGPTWTAYVRGAAALLQASGIELPGCDVLIDGDLPIGAGLSSSASLVVGALAALVGVADAEVERVALARLAQRVENEVVGVASGIMDPLAVASGRAHHVLVVDCRTAEVEPVPVPTDLRLVVLDSAVPRRLAESGYNRRRAECERAAAVLRTIDPAVVALRDATPELLAAAGGRLGAVEARRARHVVTENRRVLEAAEALRRGDGATLGRLVAESHASLRDDFEVSVAELDLLVSIATDETGVLGARLTGAGFGGAAVAIVDAPHADRAADRIVARYRERSGRQGRAFVCDLADGVRTVRR